MTLFPWLPRCFHSNIHTISEQLFQEAVFEEAPSEVQQVHTAPGLGTSAV